MRKVIWFFALALVIALTLRPGESVTGGPYADSLYIVKPEADSLHWGSKAIGAAAVVRTVRLLNHCPDSLIGVVYSSNPCYKLNGAVKDTLRYIIPDTTGVFQFTVRFIPTGRGTIDAWLYFSDPFDSIALYGSGTGGTVPRPFGTSLYGEAPFNTVTQPLNAYGQAQSMNANGIYSVILNPGASMLDISAGCFRASFDSIKVDADTTTAIFTAYADSVCTQSVSWNVSGSSYVHATTASGLPVNTLIPVRIRVCRTNDLSCCRDTTISFTTGCGALSSPIDFEIEQAPDSGFIAYWDTRTPTTDELRYYDAGLDTGWVYGWIPHFPALSHAVEVSIRLKPSTTYFVSVDGYDDCSYHKGWSDSLEFTTGADTIIGHCPTVTKSSIVTKTITASSANLTLNSSLDCIMRFRYHASPSGAWVYRTESADSSGHTISVAGLSACTGYVWQTKPIHSQCSDTTAVAYGDSTGFTTSHPAIAKSSIATKTITTSTANLTLNTDVACLVRYRYHTTPSGAWSYRIETGDSTIHTEGISGLASNTGYVWQSKIVSGTCDTTTWAYADSTAFTTLTSCPTVAQSNFAVQAISTTTATFHFHTDYATHGGYRYGLYAAANTYRHDADADSLQHTIGVTGLTANHTRYKVLFNNKYTGCDSSGAHTDQLDWYTTCTAITGTCDVCSSNEGAGPDNTFTVLASRASQVYMHYRKGAGAYSANVDMGTIATHVVNVDKSNFNAGSWNWEWWYIDECGNTSGMQTGTTFTILTGGLCDAPCGEG